MGSRSSYAPPNLEDWRVRRFIEWLCTAPEERDPPTQAELAEEVGYVSAHLSSWKRDPDFLAAWEKQYRKTVGSPERLGNVMQKLYLTATDLTDPRQVQAAKTYLDAASKMSPPAPNGPKDARKLTNDQLYEILAERAAQELTQS